MRSSVRKTEGLASGAGEDAVRFLVEEVRATTVESNSSCTSAPMAALATSSDRCDERSERSQKASSSCHASLNLGRFWSSGRKVRKSRVSELSRSTQVSSHCFDSVSREWCSSISTGRPPSVPSVCATGCCVLAEAAASLTSLVSGSSTLKSAKSHEGGESDVPCDVTTELSVWIAHVRTSGLSSLHIRRSLKRMEHHSLCEWTFSSMSRPTYRGAEASADPPASSSRLSSASASASASSAPGAAGLCCKPFGASCPSSSGVSTAASAAHASSLRACSTR
mmetsp:Transcript_36489/g.80165  ORF Transcript_36489/g.80165 Transcript_36489/m.80165 type:complete len:280 (+) Transcript_36489:323-1162(+)